MTIQANEPTSELVFAHEKLVTLEKEAHGVVYIEIYNIPKDVSKEHCSEVIQKVELKNYFVEKKECLDIFCGIIPPNDKDLRF